MKKILLVLFIILCSTPSLGTGSDVEINASKTAGEYKGYDELIINITRIQYENRTYYWAGYSKNLMYSGSLLIGDDNSPVKDVKLLELFSIADMIHKGYPPESVKQWTGYSSYFAYMSLVFKATHPALSEDAMEISVNFNESAEYMNASIQSMSPDSVAGYMRSQGLLLEMMAKSYVNAENYSAASSPYLAEYKESLGNIWGTMKESRDGLSNAGGMMAENIHTRVVSEKDKPFAETALIAISVGVLVFLFILRKLKR
jgi:hypothetical protein